MKQCDGHSKKQTQAVAKRAVVHSPKQNALCVYPMEDVLRVDTIDSNKMGEGVVKGEQKKENPFKTS